MERREKVAATTKQRFDMFLISHAMFCNLSNFTELKACFGLFLKNAGC